MMANEEELFHYYPKSNPGEPYRFYGVLGLEMRYSLLFGGRFGPLLKILGQMSFLLIEKPHVLVKKKANLRVVLCHYYR